MGEGKVGEQVLCWSHPEGHSEAQSASSCSPCTGRDTRAGLCRNPRMRNREAGFGLQGSPSPHREGRGPRLQGCWQRCHCVLVWGGGRAGGRLGGVSVCLGLCGGGCVGAEGCGTHQNMCVRACLSGGLEGEEGKSVPFPVPAPSTLRTSLPLTPNPASHPWSSVPAQDLVPYFDFSIASSYGLGLFLSGCWFHHLGYK